MTIYVTYYQYYDDLAIDWNKAKIEPVEEVYDN